MQHAKRITTNYGVMFRQRTEIGVAVVTESLRAVRGDESVELKILSAYDYGPITHTSEATLTLSHEDAEALSREIVRPATVTLTKLTGEQRQLPGIVEPDACGAAYAIAACLRGQLDEIIATLPASNVYLDEPDGGDVSLVEQFRRMAEDAAKWRDLESGRRQAEEPYRVAVFWSSANPDKQVRMLAEGRDIEEWGKRSDFIRWADAPVLPKWRDAARAEGWLSPSQLGNLAAEWDGIPFGKEPAGDVGQSLRNSFALEFAK